MAKKSSFRDKVRSNSDSQRSGKSSYGYLKLPKGVKVFTPTPGERHKFDILPYRVTDKTHPDRNDEKDVAMVGDLWYKRPFKVHKNIGVSQDAVVCPTSFGKPCPICEYRAKRTKEGADKDELDTMKPSLRNLYCVIPIGEKKMEEVPHIWDMSQYLFQELLNEELDENDENAIFPDLEEGLTLKVRFDSKTFGKSKPYAEASRIDFLERDSAYDESILENIPNLDEVLNLLSYKQIEAKFFEMEDVVDETDNDDEEEETPKKGKTTKSSVKRKEVDDEDDDDDDEPKKFKKPSSDAKDRAKKRMEEDDDEEEQPKRTKKEAPKKQPKLTWEDLEEMDEVELGEVAEQFDVELDEEEDIEYHRRQIAKELEIETFSKKPTRSNPPKKEEKKVTKTQEEEEDDDDEDEEEEQPKVTGKNACIACRGTGKNSRGKTCPICNGTGKRPKDDDEEEPAKGSAKVVDSKAKREETKGNKCPHGHEFGKDCDEFDECNTCTKWDDCVDAK